MTTSGTSSFNLDIADLITEAYERCGISVQDGYALRTARRSLDLLFADWANRGLNLWRIEQRTLALTTGVNTYDLPLDTVDVLSAVVRFSNQGVNTDITIDRISRAEYLHTPVKSQQARPSQYYVERTIQPKLYLYPTPDPSISYTFVYYAIRRIQDAGDYSNTPDVNFRFLPCLAAGLSYYLSLKKSPDRVGLLKQIYEEEYARAASEDRERASVFLTPDFGN